MRARPCSVSMCGNTATTSITAIAAPTMSAISSTGWRTTSLPRLSLSPPDHAYRGAAPAAPRPCLSRIAPMTQTVSVDIDAHAERAVTRPQFTDTMARLASTSLRRQFRQRLRVPGPDSDRRLLAFREPSVHRRLDQGRQRPCGHHLEARWVCAGDARTGAGAGCRCLRRPGRGSQSLSRRHLGGLALRPSASSRCRRRARLRAQRFHPRRRPPALCRNDHRHGNRRLRRPAALERAAIPGT